jgi:hypothetical protein
MLIMILRLGREKGGELRENEVVSGKMKRLERGKYADIIASTLPPSARKM